MTAQQMIDKLVEITQHYGDMDVIVYKNSELRWYIDHVAPCSKRDHVLIVMGERDL